MDNETDSDSEPHFFDALKQPVYVGDVCLVIGLAEKDDEKYDALVPILVVEILRMMKDSSFEYRVLITAADVGCEYQRFIMKNDAATSDQFVKVNNPEFFSDSEQMAKILVMQYDFKNSLKR